MLLDGKIVADKIISNVTEGLRGLDYSPCIVAIVVGEDPGAMAYAKVKKKRAEKCGFDFRLEVLPKDTTQSSLIELVSQYGQSNAVCGIIIERPLPEHIDFDIVSSYINPLKDVDCQSAESLGRIMLSNALWHPATAEAVVRILDFYQIDTEGADIVIIGRSLSVGLPLSMILLQKRYNATVTVCHSRTINLAEKAKKADILVAAIGRAKFIDESFVKDGAIVIDVGTNYTKDGLFGDVDFDNVENKVHAITPVPGGVGPVTVSVLLENCLRAAEREHSVSKVNY